MHRSAQFLVALAGAVLVILCGGCGVPTLSGPLGRDRDRIGNGSFEEGAEASIDAWSFWPEGMVYGKDSQGRPVDGETALRVNIRGNESFRVTQAVQGLEPGAAYLLKGFVRTRNVPDGKRNNACIAVRMEDGSVKYSPGIAGTSEWVPLRIRFTLPEDSRTVSVHLQRYAVANTAPTSGSVWFDAISLRRLSEGDTESFTNVVWIVLDSLRARNVSSYGYERKTTPRLDELAANGALFERMYAPALEAVPSVNSYMTGRLFPLHYLTVSVGVEQGYVFPRSYEMLASRIFELNGYETAIVSAHANIQGHSEFVKSFGESLKLTRANRGGVFPDKPNYRFEDINETVFPWLEKPRGLPFFLYIHAVDTHFRGVLRGTPQDQWIDASHRMDPNGNPFVRPGHRFGFSKTEMEHMRGAYDESIEYADAQVGLLVDKLKELGLFESTIVIVSSDHGILLGEDGQTWGHGDARDEEGLILGLEELRHVPCIVAGKGIPQGVRVPQLTQSMDLLPTLVDLLGLTAWAAFDGKSLKPLMDNPQAPPLHRFAVTRASNIDHEAPVIFLQGDEYVYQYSTETSDGHLWTVPYRMVSRKNVGREFPNVALEMRAYVETQILPLWKRTQTSGRSAKLSLPYGPRKIAPSEAVFPAPSLEHDALEQLEIGARWILYESTLRKAGPDQDLPPIRIHFRVRPGRFRALIRVFELAEPTEQAFKIKAQEDEEFVRLSGTAVASDTSGGMLLYFGTYDVAEDFEVTIDDVVGFPLCLGRIHLLPDPDYLQEVLSTPDASAQGVFDVSSDDLENYRKSLRARGYL